MKKFILIFCLLITSLMSNAQFKINDKLFSNGFSVDTASSISIKVINLDIQLESKMQRPVFYFSFNTKTGASIMSINIGYEDIQIACDKNGITKTEQETAIPQIFLALYAGTKSQKLSAIRGILQAYGIVVKPDTDQ